MGVYNPQRLQVYKYGILGLYIEDLGQITKGDVPIGFEVHARALEEALRFFTLPERTMYRALLDAGTMQVTYLRASNIVSSLQPEEPSRMRVIDDFLSK